MGAIPHTSQSLVQDKETNRRKVSFEVVLNHSLLKDKEYLTNFLEKSSQCLFWDMTLSSHCSHTDGLTGTTSQAQTRKWSVIVGQALQVASQSQDIKNHVEVPYSNNKNPFS